MVIFTLWPGTDGNHAEKEHQFARSFQHDDVES
jgi:hypothetical protein